MLNRALLALLAFVTSHCVSSSGDGGGTPDASSADAAVDAAPPPDPSKVIQIIAGTQHACGLKESGGVWCWGSGEMGQLPGVSSTVPVEIAGLPRDLVQLAAGDYHTCGVTRRGTVRCWGSNQGGALGPNTNVMGRIGELEGLSEIEAVTAGNGHSCALTRTKTVICWGNARAGALGNGLFDGEAQPPMEIDGLSDVQMIAAGNQHTCALTTAGAVKCWGFNYSGQVGDGTTEDRALPVDVIGLSAGVTTIGVGRGFSCAGLTGGEVRCWGDNSLQQLGTGASDAQSMPVDVTTFASGITMIAARRATIALAGDGTVSRWGLLGFDLQAHDDVPAAVALPLSDMISVADGGYFQCALSATGRAFCWGGGPKGQLGDGTNNESLTPVEVLW